MSTVCAVLAKFNPLSTFQVNPVGRAIDAKRLDTVLLGLFPDLETRAHNPISFGKYKLREGSHAQGDMWNKSLLQHFSPLRWGE